MIKILSLMIPFIFTACTNYNDIDYETSNINGNPNYTSQQETNRLNKQYLEEMSKYNISELNIIIEENISKEYIDEFESIFNNVSDKIELNNQFNLLTKNKTFSLKKLSNKNMNIFVNKIELLNNKYKYISNITYREFNNILEPNKDTNKALLIDNYITDIIVNK